jgi:diguanylate cyclase (GGDEF)-like protein
MQRGRERGNAMATDRELTDVLSEFARTMATDFPIQGILDHLVEQIVEVMPISAAGVTLIAADGEPPRYVAASSEAALRFEKLQTHLSEGPCLAAYRTDEAVSIPDLHNDDRFQKFIPEALEAGLRAVFAFPLRRGKGDALGALDLYREEAGPLDDAGMYAAQTLADVAAAYILNAQARADLREASDRFQETSLHDPLTGLPNRVLFGQHLERAMLRSRRSGNKLAVLFADLDRFKEVNDRFGHHVGDELLIGVSERLAALLRPSDTLARLAGDEFVILCEDLDTESHVDLLADRIDAGMNRSFELSGGRKVNVTASVGIAFSGAGDDVPERLLSDADAAMYQAKRLGGGSHQIFDLREQERSADRVTLGRDLQGVLSRGELGTHYQPIVNAADGRITGVEALVRWCHPIRGMVPPALLIPLAEESQLIGDIGRFVIQQTCRDRDRWQLIPGPSQGLAISVNVSSNELLSADYASSLATVIAECGVDPGLITLEVTESVFIKDPERALVVMRALKELGVQLALDDFGTGFSSLSYLRSFPMDIVKIDGSFAVDAGDDEASSAVVGALVDLAHSLGIAVIAEGMETIEQVETLSCESCQGNYFAEPMPAEEIEKLFRDCSDRGTPCLPLSR